MAGGRTSVMCARGADSARLPSRLTIPASRSLDGDDRLPESRRTIRAPQSRRQHQTLDASNSRRDAPPLGDRTTTATVLATLSPTATPARERDGRLPAPHGTT